MGILDDLREEADRKRLIEQQQAISKEQLEQNYRQKILPKMQSIFHFFKEIIEHLQFIQEPVAIEKYSPRYPDLGTLTQQNYKLSTDKYGGMTHFHDLQEIYVRFYLAGDGGMSFDVKNQAEIEQQISFLTAKRVPFEWSRHYNSVENSSATFTIERKIPVKIQFLVDFEQSRINLDIYNHINFGHIQRTYSAEDIDDHFLDQLAKFLLRKDNDFIEIEITEEEREAIRKRLKQDTNYESHSNLQSSTSEKKGGFLNKISSIFK